MFFPLYVFLGAGIGGVLRYTVNLAALRFLGENFPFGTLTVNIVGSFIMGALSAAALAKIGILASAEWRVFLMTGVLGGFTTFSTFSLDVAYLWERDAIGLTILYLGGSVVVSIAAVSAGLWLVRSLVG
jgi:fluoride exporter